MDKFVYFLAGCSFILIFNAVRDFFLMREMTLLNSFKSPADYLFYKYEMKRLANDRKHWFKIPMPFLKKQEETIPKTVVEEDMKSRMETAVSAEMAAREQHEKVKIQREQFGKRRQESSVL